MKILLVGISTRPLAQSAARLGHQVISLDLFGDSDQPAGAQVHALVRDLGEPPELTFLAKAARRFAPLADRVVVESGLENELLLLEVCPPEKRWGNSSQAVQSARDPSRLHQLLQGTGMRLPQTISPGDPLPSGGRYLLKDMNHSGGRGIRAWDGKTPPVEREVLQRFVEGDLASACFLADGRRARLLGLTRQYAGEPGLGAPPYAWCGNAAPWGTPEIQGIVGQALAALVAGCGLRGLNGIDFIVQDGVPWLLEVNPRPPASFELFERLLEGNAFTWHVEACEGRLSVLSALPPSPAWAKGILYARQDVTVGDTRGWGSQGAADIPHPGESIPAGAPICTLLAQGRDAAAAWQKILHNADGWRQDKGL